MRAQALAVIAIVLPLHAESLVQKLQLGSLTMEVMPYIVAAGDINDVQYATPIGGISDSVGGLILRTTGGNFLCSGTLLPSGSDILTAAHCVTDSAGRFDLLGGSATFFPTPAGQTIAFAGAQAFPAYNGDVFAGNDLAVIHLQSAVSSAIPRATLYTSRDEIGKTYNLVGFGVTGSNGLGFTGPAGTRHQGFNQFDATLSDIGFGSANVLLSDFDDGTAAHDGFGFFFGLPGPGLGLDEAFPAPGDSGGPTFINGQLAGITSFGLRLSAGSLTSDIDGVLNSSFGEFDGSTRVSSYNQWITGPHDFTLVPEPATWLLSLAVLALVLHRGGARTRLP